VWELPPVLAHWLRATAPEQETGMARCESCGNDYDKSFTVTKDGRVHSFDSFECAIQALAPVCAKCGVKIVGHGLEQGDRMYCCAHCAGADGATGLRDRA
jgi:hypothetical protein